MENAKFVNEFTYEGFGFPVHLSGRVPVVMAMGVEALAVPQGTLKELVALELARAPWRLTGYQIHFLRSFFRMTLQEFGSRFGDVSHAAVIAWQKKGSDPSGMGWAIEKDIRLAVVDRLCRARLAELYSELAKAKPLPCEGSPVSVELSGAA